MATDASGNVFVTGYFTGAVAFSSTLFTSLGSNDLFVAKYAPGTNTWSWAQSGGTSGDVGYGVALSGANVYTAGYVIPAVSFKPFILGSPEGGTTSLLGQLVDVLPAPTLTAVVPTPGGLGQAITLTGTGLGSLTALIINGTNALPGLVSNNGSTLVVRVLLGAAVAGIMSISTA